ncbi:MAG: hypothetical protein DBX58_02345, partial [Clostridiales bacterium]
RGKCNKKAGRLPAFIGALLDEGVKKTCRWQVFSPRVPARRTGARSANGESAPKGEVQQNKKDIRNGCPFCFGALPGTRTLGPLIKSQLLYHLLRPHLAQGSYSAVFAWN